MYLLFGLCSSGMVHIGWMVLVVHINFLMASKNVTVMEIINKVE